MNRWNKNKNTETESATPPPQKKLARNVLDISDNKTKITATVDSFEKIYKKKQRRRK